MHYQVFTDFGNHARKLKGTLGKKKKEKGTGFFTMVNSKEKEAIFFKCPHRLYKPNSFLTHKNYFIHPVQ